MGADREQCQRARACWRELQCCPAAKNRACAASTRHAARTRAPTAPAAWHPNPCPAPTAGAARHPALRRRVQVPALPAPAHPAAPVWSAPQLLLVPPCLIPKPPWLLEGAGRRRLAARRLAAGRLVDCRRRGLHGGGPAVSVAFLRLKPGGAPAGLAQGSLKASEERAAPAAAPPAPPGFGRNRDSADSQGRGYAGRSVEMAADRTGLLARTVLLLVKDAPAVFVSD